MDVIPKLYIFFLFLLYCHINRFTFCTGIVDALVSKTTAWGNEEGMEFAYDGVSVVFVTTWFQLLDILDMYSSKISIP